MKLLITGGSGFIGSNFIRYIFERHSEISVLNYDKITYAANPANLGDAEKDPRYKFVKGDVASSNDFRQAISEYGPDYIVHFAGETHVDRSLESQDNFESGFIYSNVFGTHNLLGVVKDFPELKKYVQISTYDVYGDLDPSSLHKFKEDSLISPESIYAMSKASADIVCRTYINSFNIPIVTARLSNVFGPFQYPEKLVARSISRLLRGENALLQGNGEQIREWTFVRDICSAIELCLFKGRAGEIYNVGSGNELNNLEVLSQALKILGLDESRIDFIKDRPSNGLRRAVDSSKIREELGWLPNVSFEEGMRETVNWYKENIDKFREKRTS